MTYFARLDQACIFRAFGRAVEGRNISALSAAICLLRTYIPLVARLLPGRLLTDFCDCSLEFLLLLFPDHASTYIHTYIYRHIYAYIHTLCIVSRNNRTDRQARQSVGSALDNQDRSLHVTTDGKNSQEVAMKCMEPYHYWFLLFSVSLLFLLLLLPPPPPLDSPFLVFI